MATETGFLRGIYRSFDLGNFIVVSIRAGLILALTNTL